MKTLLSSFKRDREREGREQLFSVFFCSFCFRPYEKILLRHTKRVQGCTLAEKEDVHFVSNRLFIERAIEKKIAEGSSADVCRITALE